MRLLLWSIGMILNRSVGLALLAALEKDTLYRSNTEVSVVSGCAIRRSKPVNLSLLKVNRPKNFPTTTTNSNNNNDVVSDEYPTPANESNKDVAEPPNPNEAAMGVDTTATRGGTLSQPCLSMISTIGATQIFPHLFLGSQKDVVDENLMRSNGITYVLNVSKTCTKPEFIDDDHFHRISVHDSYQENITPHMIEAIEFIEKVRKSNQRVIVHCLAGVSRSATVAIAYVLHYLRISFEDAYRFVKEKRPSISPNFNFLGQLMEFEKTLRLSGHLACKRTGSLSEDGSDDDQPTFNCHADSDSPRTSLKLSILDSSPDFSPRMMPGTLSFTCSTQASAPHQAASGTTLRISTPTSSFCRRRNGPTFSKAAFSFATTNSNNNCSNRKCDSALPKFLGSKTPFGDSGVVVDVRVDVPATTPRISEASRRLGSDGYENDEATSCAAESSSYSSDAFSPMSNQEISPEEPQQSMDCSENTEDYTDDNKFAKPQTASENSTAALARQKSDGSSPWQTGQLAPPKPTQRHRRCASGGGIIANILQSPLNMKRRFEARTECSSSIGELILCDQSTELAHSANVKRGASFSGSYYDHSTTSSRSPHKFISVNSRSPKILRKSFHLNLPPVYSNAQARSSMKSEDAAAPVSRPGVLGMDTQVPVFDCSHSMSGNVDPLRLGVAKGRTHRGQTDMEEGTTPEAESDDTLVINGMSPLTLSSPNVDKDGSPLFPSTDSAKATSPATCPVLTTQKTNLSFARVDSPPRFVHKGLFTFTPKARHVTDAKTSQPFMLSASCDFKLKWRNKDLRRQSADSGYLSSQASSQSSSSLTSPTSQQMVFGCASSQESLPEVASPSDSHSPSPVNSTCHAEGAYESPDDVTNSNSDSDGRKTNVRQQIVSCS